jgi:hypothetical protein
MTPAGVRGARRALASGLTLVALLSSARANESPSPVATPTPIPEPSPAFGRVVYRASKAASFESLGISVIACRHRDPGPRTVGVEFFDRRGNKVGVFGPHVIPDWPPGKKIVFVSDSTYFKNRGVIDVRVGHLADGTARIISDARVIHCLAKIRFDPGARLKSYSRSMGLYREGVGATPVPVEWW